MKKVAYKKLRTMQQVHNDVEHEEDKLSIVSPICENCLFWKTLSVSVVSVTYKGDTHVLSEMKWISCLIEIGFRALGPLTDK